MTLLLSPLVGCGTNKPTTEAARQQSLAECAPGWWTDKRFDCSAACAGSSPNVECAAPDCQQFGFLGLLDDGSSVDGVISYSATAASISSVGPIVRSTYTITQDGVIKTPPGTVAMSKCAGNEATATYATYYRADTTLSNALRAATQQGATFAGVKLVH